MLKKDYVQYILRPVLSSLSLHSLQAEQLMIGTLICETNFDYLRQVQGPALGIYQIEPATHNDIKRYLNRLDKNELKEHVLTACYYICHPPDSALIHNLAYATVIARLKYAMNPKRLPIAGDVRSQAQYYKDIYNTAKGGGSVDRYIDLYSKHINEYI